MASVEEEMAVVFTEPVSHLLAKGKRTKRNRSLVFSNSSCCDSELSIWQAEDTSFSLVDSFDCSEGMTSEEEEDMANCLILLAQGEPRGLQSSQESVSMAYQCKTCSKMFSSFQALGGHRASHKKPRVFEIERKQISSVGNNRSRPHECSFCGAEFATGQALGGHMRRHRGAAQVVAGGGRMNLDLNLPAPEEDHVCREVEVEDKRRSGCSRMAFSATAALVGCHY